MTVMGLYRSFLKAFLWMMIRGFVSGNLDDDVLWPKISAWYDELGRSRE